MSRQMHLVTIIDDMWMMVACNARVLVGLIVCGVRLSVVDVY